MLEILSSVALDLKNSAAPYQLGNLCPSVTKLCLKRNKVTKTFRQDLGGNTVLACIQKEEERLTSPSSNISFSCLDHREEKPGAEVLAGDLIREERDMNADYTRSQCIVRDIVERGLGFNSFKLPIVCRDVHDSINCCGGRKGAAAGGLCRCTMCMHCRCLSMREKSFNHHLCLSYHT